MPSALSAARPAAVALVLIAAVVLTGFVLYAFWPAGVALGLGLGIVAVLAIGARMHVSERPSRRTRTWPRSWASSCSRRRSRSRSARRPSRCSPPSGRTRSRRRRGAGGGAVAGGEVAPVAEQRPVLRPRRSVRRGARPHGSGPRSSVPPPSSSRGRERRRRAREARRPAARRGGGRRRGRAGARARAARAARRPVLHLRRGPRRVGAAPRRGGPGPHRPRAPQGGARRRLPRLRACARLVVSTQYASAARLQRDLDLPYSRASAARRPRAAALRRPRDRLAAPPGADAQGAPARGRAGCSPRREPAPPLPCEVRIGSPPTACHDRRVPRTSYDSRMPSRTRPGTALTAFLGMLAIAVIAGVMVAVAVTPAIALTGRRPRTASACSRSCRAT